MYQKLMTMVVLNARSIHNFLKKPVLRTMEIGLETSKLYVSNGLSDLIAIILGPDLIGKGFSIGF